MTRYFITGGTGTIGSSLVSHLLQENSDDTFVIATRKVPSTNDNVRVNYLYCDFSTDHYKTAITEDIIQNTDIVLHLAADVRWDIPLDLSEKCNVGPTKGLIALFKRNKNLQKFIFASTAASHPPARMDGIVPLATLDGYNFANCYEYTKYICEKYLREQTDFPWMVVRFPLVKGDSKTGEINRFIGSYLIYRFFIQGKMPTYVGRYDAPVDFVPIDYVLKGFFDAIKSEKAQKTYIVTENNGQDTLKDFIEVSLDLLNDYCQNNGYQTYNKLPLISPSLYFAGMRHHYLSMLSPIGQREFTKIESFIPYSTYLSPIPHDHVDEVVNTPSQIEFLKPCIQYWCEAEKKRFKAEKTLSRPEKLAEIA